MKSLDLKPFYAHSLGMATPWKVTDVVFDREPKVVTTSVECASGVAWADPETGERAEIKDWQERTWRHLDTCQFQTIVKARVPRLLLKNGKSIIASVPWAQRSARVTRALESHAIDALLNCRTERAASRLSGPGEDMLDGIMARAVRDRLPQAARRVSAANHKAVGTVLRREHARLRRSGVDTLKGTKHQWLRTYAHLRRQEARDFRRLLRQDLRTAKAWALKENFRRIWSYRSVAGAMRLAHDWAGAVAHAGLRPMIKAAETVKCHLWGIAGFVTHPITNAATEGLNPMMQSLRHSARGLPNFASMRNRVLFHPGGLQLKPS